MKKLLSTITIIAILGILASVGFFGYNKFQEVELEKDKLQAEADKKDDKKTDAASESDDLIQENQVSNNEINSQEKSIQKESNTSSDDGEVVNRENVFDYLIAEIDSQSGNDSSKIKFQEPQYKGGYWLIPANNKSGSGSYAFKVYDDGEVDLE